MHTHAKRGLSIVERLHTDADAKIQHVWPTKDNVDRKRDTDRDRRGQTKEQLAELAEHVASLPNN